MDTLERVNARLMINQIRDQVGAYLGTFQDELNDQLTRDRVQTHIRAYLDHGMMSHLFRSFNVICDETNNTPEHIDNGSLRVDVFIQPNSSAEIIQLRFDVGEETMTLQEKFKSDADAWRYRLGI